MGNLLLVVFSFQPFLDVKVASTVQGDRVAVEEVWYENEVAVGCELVGDELKIGEFVAYHVCDAGKLLESRPRVRHGDLQCVHQDAIFGGPALGKLFVDLEVTELFDFTCRVAFVRDALVAAGARRVRRHIELG